MSARDQLRQGNLDQALAELMNEVRNEPAKAKHRIFLFQLLSVTGDWNRALTHLNVARELDPAAGVMAQAYQEILACEALRTEVFQGTRSPLVFGEPESWIAGMIQALALDARGEYAAAASLRQQALEEAPAISGSLDYIPQGTDEPASANFDWIADADTRLGPLVEMIVNGRYYWAPWQHIAEVRLDPPADLRDMVWAPAHFRWRNGGEAVGVIPTRYAGTERQTDHALRLSRATSWNEPREGVSEGLGQRVLMTDAAEYGLLQIRRISLPAATGDAVV